MQKFDKSLKCPKCGFSPTFSIKWKLEFKSECSTFGYNKCEWDDTVSKEHLHQECPDCGYTLPVACLDNDKVAADAWSTTTPVLVVPPTPIRSIKPETGYFGGPSVIPAVQPVVPVKCRTCPVG